MWDKLALILLIIGGVNWGLVGIFEFDLVAWLFGGAASLISRAIYILVAISAVWCITLLFRNDQKLVEVEAYRRPRQQGAGTVGHGCRSDSCLLFVFQRLVNAWGDNPSPPLSFFPIPLGARSYSARSHDAPQNGAE